MGLAMKQNVFKDDACKKRGAKGHEPCVTPNIRRLVREASRRICQGAARELRIKARGVPLKPSEGGVLGLESYSVKSFVYQRTLLFTFW